MENKELLDYRFLMKQKQFLMWAAGPGITPGFLKGEIGTWRCMAISNDEALFAKEICDDVIISILKRSDDLVGLIEEV